MASYGYMGMSVMVPALLLLTVSFFILAAGRKMEKGALKSFGNIIAMLIWAVTAVLLASGIYAVSDQDGRMKRKRWKKHHFSNMGSKRMIKK